MSKSTTPRARVPKGSSTSQGLTCSMSVETPVVSRVAYRRATKPRLDGSPTDQVLIRPQENASQATTGSATAS